MTIPPAQLDAIDFELELLRRDQINVAYILALIATLKAAGEEGGEAGARKARATRKRIMDVLNGEAQLRPKKEVIEAFLTEHLPKLGLQDDVSAALASFWNEARSRAFAEICAVEGADPVRLEAVMPVSRSKSPPEAVQPTGAHSMQRMLFTGRDPGSSEIVDAMTTRPVIVARRSVTARVLEAIRRFVGVFDECVGEIERT